MVPRDPVLLSPCRRPPSIASPHLKFDPTIHLKSRSRVADWSGGEKRQTCCNGATVVTSRASGRSFPRPRQLDKGVFSYPSSN